MSDSEDGLQANDTRCWHRKSCSNRIFIGPWDIRASPPASPPPSSEQMLSNAEQDSSSIVSDASIRLLHEQTFASSDNSIKAMHKTSRKESGTSTKSPNSGQTTADQLIARPRINSTAYNSIDLQPHSLEHIVKRQEGNDQDGEIDYIPSTLAQPSSPPEDDNDDEQLKTAKPNSKGKLPMGHQVNNTPPTTPSPTQHNKKKIRTKHIHRSSRNPLIRKKAGFVFVSSLPTIVTPEPASIPTGRPIKREPILCMRSATGYLSNEPTRYKAAKEARYDLLTEKWRQVELVLTASYLSTYSSSLMFWPKQRLEHRVYLEGARKPKRLELFLLSALDYSFCLRFQSNSGHAPMMITMTFKARSFLKCQEWYMQLYNMLPNENKRPIPQWCSVYIPTLDLSVNLPLTKKNSNVTMEDVKEAVITVLENEGDLVQRLVQTDQINRNVSVDDLGLCWTTKDRAEWIYWTHASSDSQNRIDYAICPQNIEQTHRLELRLIEHTPYDIILRENMTLKEPPPVEGFLMRASDFTGKGAFNKMKMNYFASFDQYLFYIPASKVASPNMACFIDEDLLPKNIRAQPYVSAVSPYTPTCTPDVEVGEVARRMRLMTESKGFIDLTEVSYVRRTFSDDLPDLDESGISGQLSLTKRSSRSPILPKHDKPVRKQSFFVPIRQNHRKPCLEIIMENGLQARFEVYSSETCDLWVNYLAQIIVYWKARKEAEKDAHSHDSFVLNPAIQSENALIKTGANTEDGCTHRKERLADTRIWSYCLYEQCRDVVKSGVLYYKPHKRGTYSQKIFILTANGWILFFDVYNRESSKKVCNHEKRGVIDVAGCYFYSGVDCSKQKKGSNHHGNQWKKAARIYSNGLSTDDDSLSCMFSIWKPKIRRYFSPKRQRLRVYRHDQRLSPEGQTWTFLARSRREKEEWVCALNTVTEHMIRCENR
ncbi:hypothetical protein [Parasitella parasitica]|uniref:PH domain-containing protein n=1 Tax=Parasitella parasitica TaxID=35722 RepID=A0A0B7NMI5_9FUNG|nr:hypothetical protein [Parasitella parasitica]